MPISPGEQALAAEVAVLKDVDYPHFMLCLNAPSSVGQGTWITFYEEFAAILNSSNANLDNLTFKVSLRAGTYALFIVVQKTANSGILDIDVDGVEKGSINLYNATVIYDEYSIVSIVIASDKIVEFSFRVDGKHASSGGYYACFGEVTIGRSS